MEATEQLAVHVFHMEDSPMLTEESFRALLFMSLWGNKADLSLKPGGLLENIILPDIYR